MFNSVQGFSKEDASRATDLLVSRTLLIFEVLDAYRKVERLEFLSFLVAMFNRAGLGSKTAYEIEQVIFEQVGFGEITPKDFDEVLSSYDSNN